MRMVKILIFLFAIIGFTLSAKQIEKEYVPMLEVGNKWDYYSQNFFTGGTRSFEFIVEDKDVEDDGVIYKSVRRQNYPYDEYVLMREENGRVYVKCKEWFDGWNGPLDEEILIYDFTLNPGDLFPYYNPDTERDNFRVRVKSVKNITVKGLNLRVLFTSSENLWDNGEWKSYDSYTYCEGIGPIDQYGGPVIAPGYLFSTPLSIDSPTLSEACIDGGKTSIFKSDIDAAIKTGYIPLCNENYVWTYHNYVYKVISDKEPVYEVEKVPVYQYRFFDGTKEINGNTYHILWGSRQKDKHASDRWIDAYMRESDVRVYACYPDESQDNGVSKEILLYDFNMKERDSYSIPTYGPDYSIVSDFDIKNVTVENKGNASDGRRVVITSSFPAGYESSRSLSFSFAEGIGVIDMGTLAKPFIDPFFPRTCMSPATDWENFTGIEYWDGRPVDIGDTRDLASKLKDGYRQNYIPTLGYGNQWLTYKKSDTDEPNDYTLYYVGDEGMTVNNKQYIDIWQKKADYKADEKEKFSGFMWENNGKLYRIIKSVSDYNDIEDPVCDYTLEKGDEISNFKVGDQDKNPVSSKIKSTHYLHLIDSETPQKVFVVENKYKDSDTQPEVSKEYVYVEGIGFFPGSLRGSDDEALFGVRMNEGKKLVYASEIDAALDKVGVKTDGYKEEKNFVKESSVYNIPSPAIENHGKYKPNYMPLVEQGNEWTYEYRRNILESPGESIYRIDGTESRDGKAYHKLWHRTSSAGDKDKCVALLREEDQRVYCIRLEDEPSGLRWGGKKNEETLIYDINLNIGDDSFLIPHYAADCNGEEHLDSPMADGCRNKVTVKGKIKIGYRYLTMMEVTYSGKENDPYPSVMVEGVGNVYWGSVAFPYNDGFWKWDKSGFHPEILKNARIAGGTLEVPSWEELKKLIDNSVSLEDAVSDNDLRIGSSHGVIYVHGLKPGNSYSIYSSDGSCVYSGADETVSGLIPGIYIVKCGNKAEKIIL